MHMKHKENLQNTIEVSKSELILKIDWCESSHSFICFTCPKNKLNFYRKNKVKS